MESSLSSSISSKLDRINGDIFARVKNSLQLNLMQLNTCEMFKETYFPAITINKSNIMKWFIIYICVFYCCLFSSDSSFILS